MNYSELVRYAVKQYGVYKVLRSGDVLLINPYTQNLLFFSNLYNDEENMESDDDEEYTEPDCKFFINCGRCVASAITVPYLYPSYWDDSWLGVRFEQCTDPKAVYGLFAWAVAHDEQCFAEQNGWPLAADAGLCADLDQAPDALWAMFGTKPSAQRLAVSERIRKMYALYNSDADINERLIDKQFYQQSKLMADCEDDCFWTGLLRNNLRVYCELNLRQLRGYFAWRTSARSGVFRPADVAFAYIYIYELLNGIGASSPEDGFRKMQALETGFIDSYTDGHKELRRNLHRWMFDYAVINNFPVESARQYHEGQSAEIDAHILALKNPWLYSDEEIFAALCYFGEKDLRQSPLMLADASRGKRLFAGVWRYMTAAGRTGNNDVFGDFFGKRRSSAEWRPYAGAIYCKDSEKVDTKNRKYELNENHVYTFRNGKWNHSFYNPWNSRDKIRAVFHEAERVFRQVFKLGHAMRSKHGEEWITPYAAAAAEQELRTEAEADRPKISIDFSGLEQIRREAQVTKESLLTAEDLGENAGAGADAGTSSAGGAEEPKGIQAGSSQPGTRAAETKAFGFGNEINIVSALDEADAAGCVSGAEEPESDRDGVSGASAAEAGSSFGPAAAAADCVIKSASALSAAEKEPGGMPAPGNSGIVLDAVHAHILTELLRGRPVDGYIKQHRLMPSLAAETVNEAFFEKIGDNILECEGDLLILVEEYIDDVMRILEEG